MAVSEGSKWKHRGSHAEAYLFTSPSAFQCLTLLGLSVAILTPMHPLEKLITSLPLGSTSLGTISENSKHEMRVPHSVGLLSFLKNSLSLSHTQNGPQNYTFEGCP
ncbi:hypothetical protein L207DRAFT_78291 [Hyaloscypha variabilis F]|uniref:Uncharacterized protein n=1 Tax=Hyaloscypha variabilis (strain UAMH 11265 / GT02V1 / F) TaxID=1149755 RepID=A0A2J6RGF3_HYAVF|nr:hypothetical protein L207DRAFT_78291 [Hyaloscypha variabilis F]